jgi:hypothetical protein
MNIVLFLVINPLYVNTVQKFETRIYKHIHLWFYSQVQQIQSMTTGKTTRFLPVVTLSLTWFFNNRFHDGRRNQGHISHKRYSNWLQNACLINTDGKLSSVIYSILAKKNSFTTVQNVKHFASFNQISQITHLMCQLSVSSFILHQFVT